MLMRFSGQESEPPQLMSYLLLVIVVMASLNTTVGLLEYVNVIEVVLSVDLSLEGTEVDKEGTRAACRSA